MKNYISIVVFLSGLISGISISNLYDIKSISNINSSNSMIYTSQMVRDGINNKQELILMDSNENAIKPTTSNVVESLVKNINNYDIVHAKLISDYHKLAISEQSKYGFPASVKLAQMILEGGYSKDNPKGSKLAQEANNPFGIKYFGEGIPERVQKWDELVYSKDYVLAKDDCKGKCRFIKFRGIWHAFRYHSEFMTGVEGFPSHYSKYITTGDWKDWISAIRMGNYATYKYYHIELTNLIEKYKLYQLDKFG